MNSYNEQEYKRRVADIEANEKKIRMVANVEEMYELLKDTLDSYRNAFGYIDDEGIKELIKKIEGVEWSQKQKENTE